MPKILTREDVYIVECDGRVAGYSAGQFYGDAEMVAFARNAMELHLPIQIHREADPVTASSESSDGIVAALFAYNAGRTLLSKAPQQALNSWGWRTLSLEEESDYLLSDPLDEDGTADDPEEAR